jgi:hypothetical protein
MEFRAVLSFPPMVSNRAEKPWAYSPSSQKYHGFQTPQFVTCVEFKIVTASLGNRKLVRKISINQSIAM